MAKVMYRIHQNGDRTFVTLPQKLAFALGILDLEGNLKSDCVRFDHGYDDEGSYGIIRPVKHDELS